MGDRAKRRASYEDVLRAPANKVAEILDGELILSPRPAGLHAAAASALGEELGPPFKRGRGGPGGWIILDEPELHPVVAAVAHAMADRDHERLRLAGSNGRAWTKAFSLLLQIRQLSE